MQLENLRLIKLSSSETVIAEVQSETNTTLIVIHPLRALVIPSKTSSSSLNLAMMKWEMFHDFEEPMVLNKYAVLAIGKVNDEIRTAYIDAMHRYHEIIKLDQSTELDNTDDDLEKELEMILKSLDTKGRVLH
jgi:hypothetical protein